MKELNSSGSIGISLTQGMDRLSVFKSDPAPTSGGNYRYQSNRLPYRMLALKYEHSLPLNFWISFALGRWDLHAVNRMTAVDSCPDCPIYMRGSINELAMLIDIHKTYASFGIGWQTEIMDRLSFGFVALNFISKGDTSGVEVNTINGRFDNERSRVHSAAVQYARRDYIQPPQLTLQKSF